MTKFRTSDVSLILNSLKSQGYVIESIEETVSPKATIYVLYNSSKSMRASVYRTKNSWVEVTYKRYAGKFTTSVVE